MTQCPYEASSRLNGQISLSLMESEGNLLPWSEAAVTGPCPDQAEPYSQSYILFLEVSGFLNHLKCRPLPPDVRTTCPPISPALL